MGPAPPAPAGGRSHQGDGVGGAGRQAAHVLSALDEEVPGGQSELGPGRAPSPLSSLPGSAAPRPDSRAEGQETDGLTRNSFPSPALAATLCALPRSPQFTGAPSQPHAVEPLEGVHQGPPFQPLAPGSMRSTWLDLGCPALPAARPVPQGWLRAEPPTDPSGTTDPVPDTVSLGCGAQDRRGWHGGVSGVWGFSLGPLPQGSMGGPAEPRLRRHVCKRERTPRPPDLSDDNPPHRARGPEAAYPFIPHWGPQEFFTIQ